MLRLLKPSVTFLLVGLCLWWGCGGKGQAGAQNSTAGGQAGHAGEAPGPATHMTECEALCARTADAGCAAGDDACTMGCATVTGFSACQSQIQAWLDCAKVAEVACDSSGIPTFAGCDIQLGLAAACAAMTPPPPAVQTSCSSYCDDLEGAGCTATTPLGECRQACGLAGMVVAACQSSFLDYVNCAVSSGESCDVNGELNATICTAQQLVYMGCVLSKVGQASMPMGSGGTAAR